MTNEASTGGGLSPSSPLIQLLAVLLAEPVFTRDRRLYVGDERLEPHNVSVATVATPSQDRQLLAVATLQKQVTIFERLNRDWKSLCTHLLPKRITAVAIDDAFTHVVVSDAVGDVYRLPLDQSVDLKNDDLQHDFLLLGHFSTVTDISLTTDFIATADRDNKIRVSRYPCSYVIESFCLSHNQFVTTLQWTLVPNLLLSAGGDSTIRLWDGANGRHLDCLRLSDSKVVQNALTDAIQPLVVKFATHPLNKDVAFFVMHKCDAVFTLFGLGEAKLRGIALASSFSEKRYVTGLSISSKGHAYVSVHNEACVRQASLSSSTEVACRKLNFTVREHVTSAGESDCRELNEQEEDDMLRFNWLARQRKKDMVHNWKGKKRRHIEI